MISTYQREGRLKIIKRKIIETCAREPSNPKIQYPQHLQSFFSALFTLKLSRWNNCCSRMSNDQSKNIFCYFGASSYPGKYDRTPMISGMRCLILYQSLASNVSTKPFMHFLREYDPLNFFLMCINLLILHIQTHIYSTLDKIYNMSLKCIIIATSNDW